MKIVFLGPYREEFIDFLMSFQDEVETTEEPLAGDSRLLLGADFIISYGYRHILKRDVLDKFPNRVINLHISLLPWNKGADPNLWSFLEDTPKGVTIHYVDRGVDTGDMLAQQQVDYLAEDTLRTSYDRLSKAIEDLFKRVWPDIRAGGLKSLPQPGGGTYHRLNDRAVFNYLLEEGWNTSVEGLVGKALMNKGDAGEPSRN